MMEKKTSLVYEEYNDITELDAADAALLQQARDITKQAYAPYSQFQVGAAALLNNGQLVLGTNQENASYPVGTCAERVLLGTAANQFLDIPISAMAISYQGAKVISDHPISPCGMCRQALVEYESRMKQPMRLILGGMEGHIYIIRTAADLLPFAFTSTELK
ncbi:MAG: cytidine deaminase [Chitinophagaceae bacterium]|nr:cytidine deaminase [Chitinophagaceae bacterium]